MSVARRPVLDGLRRFLRNGTGLLGGGLLLAVLGLALGGGWLTPFAPFKSAGQPLQPPTLTHLMGTDDLGRDVWTGVVYGARTSLIVGMATAALAALIGGLIGIISGYSGGWVDDFLMRFTEFFQTLPRFFCAVIVIALFGSGIENLVVVLGLTSWTTIARVVRSQTLSLRRREFIMAARSIGADTASILRRHLLPNVTAPLLTTTSLLVGQAILMEASLSFLGLGDPNVASWGTMLNEARSFLRIAWWTSFFPGLAIALTVLGVNLSADALNDTLNPYAHSQ